MSTRSSWHVRPLRDADIYRGPMAIENDQSMCQVRDPWGNCIGLRGPHRQGDPA